tara:strand:- start:12912 stop:13076 length:165 start_codon:yes stop_codon:yes gene_type:complete
MKIRNLTLLKIKENKSWSEIQNIIDKNKPSFNLKDVKKDYFDLIGYEQYIFSLS